MLRGVVHSLCLCFTEKHPYSLFAGLGSILKICMPLESHHMQDEFHSFTEVRILDLQVTCQIVLVISHKQT